MTRIPEELPQEYVLYYPPELKEEFIPLASGRFSCIKPSAEAPKLSSNIIELPTE